MCWSYLLIVTAIFGVCYAAQKPNIVFIFADDLGWNDVGYVNPDIISPNIDYLAKNGVILDQYYVQPVCTPSRSAFMTGIYPYRLGLQHLVIMPNQDVCLPLDKKLLPQVLKENGYTTHMLGKWHLGLCKWECTPTYRGFDTFFGFYNGAEDHYSKTVANGYDFRNNTEVYKDAAKNYSSYVYGDRMDQIIKEHDTNKPMFMYMAFQNVHNPLQVPKEYEQKYSNIKDKNRRLLSAMVTAMDDAIQRLIQALKDKNMYDNTLIVFSADNGGWTSYGGNNYPLRGGKVSIFEGGTRVAGFMHGPMLNKTGNGKTESRYTGLMHAVDWFPTLVEAAGIKYEDPNQDGMSQWKAINQNGSPKRHEVIYNLDYHIAPLQGQAAIRIDDYKLIDGYPGMFQDWYKPASVSGQGVDYTNNDDVSKYYNQTVGGSAGKYKYLFNLKDDPTEHNNLYDKLPEVVNKLEARLKEEKEKRYVDPNYPAGTAKSNPSNFGGNWSPGWC